MPSSAVFLLSVLALCSSKMLFVIQASMLTECTFGEAAADNVDSQEMTATFSAKLSPYRDLPSHLCVVKVSEPDHFLRIKVKRNTQWKGFLHMSVYGLFGEEESNLLGHLDVLKNQSEWSSLTLCPPRFNNEIRDRKLAFSGSANLNFTIKIESVPGKIDLNHLKTFELNPGNPKVVFLFIPPQDISKTQLDVTVTSESDVPAYLKVSKVCKDVTENIRLVDYKGESIRLSFAKKGRITLSKVSVPQITDSTTSWFIGIALKNDTGKTVSDARKTVKLTLARSFDYSYALPIIVLVIATSLSGVVVSAIAFVCFKDLFYAQDVTRDPRDPRDPRDRGGFCAHLSLCWEVVYGHWFTRGPKTYSYLTGIVGFVLMVGASQFVYANWRVMIDEGDRDQCYYNDFCYRVSPWHDIPYNLMMSNLVYILHGIILAACVCCMEANMLRQCRRFRRDNLKRRISFSIGYGFAWALILEGCFSLIYHLCPSKMTFQFDTAFMFVIVGLVVTLLYNGIKVNMVPAKDARGPVGAANAFIFFFVPLLVFNYFGALNHFSLDHSEKGMSITSIIIVLVFLGIWWCVIAFWAWYYKLLPVIPKNPKGLCLCLGFSVFGVLLPIILFAVYRNNLPQVFLFFYISVGIFVILVRACYLCCEGSVRCSVSVCTLRSVYVILVIGLWAVSLYFFKGKETTDKSQSPEQSRDKNHECESMDFFDSHDIWHILSSHALLMVAYLVMFMSYEKPAAFGGGRVPARPPQVAPQPYHNLQPVG